MLTCHLQLKMKTKTECPFMVYRLFVKKKRLPLLSTINLLLVEFIHILTTFSNLTISLVLFTHWLIDASEYAMAGLHTELVCLKEIFLKNGYLEYFILKRSLLS